MSEKHENVCRVVNYFEHLLVFFSAVSGCTSVSTFVLSVGVSVGIASSVVGLKISVLIKK